MKLLYVYAFLIFFTKIAVADNFNDLWKKYGGEVLSGNKNNSINTDVNTYRLKKAERETEILKKKIMRGKGLSFFCHFVIFMCANTMAKVSGSMSKSSR